MNRAKEAGIVDPLSHNKLPSDAEFLQLSGYIKRIAGINLPLSDKNLVLVSGRLQKLQRSGLCSSYKDVIACLERNDQRVVNEFVMAMTTNTTSFFREKDHFEILADLLPEMSRLPSIDGTVRIWCSPCSTGEEAVSIGITVINECGPTAPVRILATDIDGKVLRTAQAGKYPVQKLKEIPLNFQRTFFRVVEHDERECIQVDRSVLSLIQFGQFNLLKNYPFEHRFAAIFCRNVLIYFEKNDAEYVVRNLRDQLCTGGYLFLGHSETAAGNVSGLVKVGPAVYKKVA